MAGREKAHVPYGDTFINNWQSMEFDEAPGKGNGEPVIEKREALAKVQQQIGFVMREIKGGRKFDPPHFHMALAVYVDRFENTFKEDPLTPANREWFNETRSKINAQP